MKKGKIKLKNPIPDRKGNEITELEFKGLKLKHRNLFPAEVQKGERELTEDEMVQVLAGIFDIPVKSVGEIDLEDVPKLMEEVKNFFETSPST